MIVSWKWIQDYVSPTSSMDEVIDKLTMSGLNHESTTTVIGDSAIDLEVTSNRSDCLGHLGVAREIAVLFDHELAIPVPAPQAIASDVHNAVGVKIDCPELCPRYTARVIRGVKVGPSPKWLQERLEAVGVNSVNNIVDVTNYVMMECGQPLHAFDLAKIRGAQIWVREAEAEEEFLAIDHKTYTLSTGMCVIADAESAIALGGVMGGADSEVSASTVDLLIEAAEFASQAIRQTARQLKLHSDASYRFERPLDSHGVDWASRRCCELILQLAGGELLEGVVDVGAAPTSRAAVELRFAQIPRVLGIDVPVEESVRILTALGCTMVAQDEVGLKLTPPTWRSDLTREIDLIEEIARVYGYDQIPEDVAVPMIASHLSDRDRSLATTRQVMTSLGFDEAMTASLVPESWESRFSPWSDAASLKSMQAMEGVLDRGSQTAGPVCCLRRSLLPSLVEARRINEFRGNEDVELFEIAKVYLPRENDLPEEPLLLSVVSQGDFFTVKGVVETLLHQLHVAAPLQVAASSESFLDITFQAHLSLGGRPLGWIGELSESAMSGNSLRRACTVGEINLETLFEHVQLVPQQNELSAFPYVDRDFNFIVDESVAWSDLESAVRAASGEVLEHVLYREVFRNPERDGASKKRVLLSVRLRANDETLTGEQADKICQAIIERCQLEHQAGLVG
jgi:phenylalanyl-tRNA synthetase beta chain